MAKQHTPVDYTPVTREVTEAEFQCVRAHALDGTYRRSQTKVGARLGLHHLGWRKEVTVDDKKAAEYALHVAENNTDQTKYVMSVINNINTSVKLCNLKAKQRDKAILDSGFSKLQVDSLSGELKSLNSIANEAKKVLYDLVEQHALTT